MARGKHTHEVGRSARSGQFLTVRKGRTKGGSEMVIKGRRPLRKALEDSKETIIAQTNAAMAAAIEESFEDVARARHVKASPGWAWPAEIVVHEDGEHVITCAAWPGLAAGGATLAEAIEDASGALEELALSALAQGEAWPPAARPTGGDQVLVALTPYAAMRGLLARWADAFGRGAQTEMAKRLGKDRKHAQRLLDPDTPVQSDSLAEAVSAIGVTPVISFALARPAGRALEARADQAAAAALDDLGGR
jgi:antitoxin HicB